jgi:hypothetical protein
LTKEQSVEALPPTARRKQSITLGWRVAIGLALSLALLALAFWQADFGRLWQILLGADRRLMLAALGLNLIGLVLRAARWRVLFWRLTDRPFGAFLDGVNIGYLVNNLFPVRLGDVVRGVLLSRWILVSASEALSATVLERVLDSGLILLLFFGLFPLLPLPPGAGQVGLLGALAVGAALTVMLLAVAQQARAERWLRWLLLRTRLPNQEVWAGRAMGLIRGLETLRHAPALVQFLLWSVLVWAQTVLTFWVTMLAFLPDLPLTYGALATVAAALGLAAPSAPAGIGTFEGAVVGALVLVDVEPDLARSMAIALHGLPFAAILMAGLWSLARRGLGYRGLAQAAAEGRPPAA